MNRQATVDLSIKSKHFAIAVSILILFGIGSSISYVKAETINMYVEDMPQHWQDQYGDVLSNAVQYWQSKIPDLKLNTTQYVDGSDFVVEWASQYGEGKLGYYSTNTENVYGKPIMAITLGFFKDKKWHLASSEQILQITKHELGHAIGLPYSADPNDIMYPTVEDYESWQQDSEQIQASTDASTDWHSRSEKYQSLASDAILPLASRVDKVQSSLSSMSYDSTAASAHNNAWIAFWWAKKYLDSAEKIQTDAGSAVLQSNYHDSYIEFKLSYDYAKKAEQKLTQITEYIEKAKV